ncbi:MAG TPA: phosphatidate cytidylyltransferase, partial [Candidatus Dependentiae bacterium]|nr:phosphatidate cytidylyltransferase [Candidatus Dependentiae bacterium]
TATGKHKIASFISPNKTWEGALGGYIFACIGLFLIVWEQEIIKPWWFILGFTLTVCTLSLIGDLFESWLKRRTHIKDSGTYLPGHGGFLDRFDGIMFAVFFFYIFRDLLISLFYLS